MRIVTVRRISQAFFGALFLWFCMVTSWGESWWQLRGWPVNWFLQLDPLVALGTLLATGTLYAGLLWALVTVVLTVVLGRFFCSWLCPFGSLQHLVGYLVQRGQSFSRKVAANRYRSGQVIKYYVLVFLLAAACGALLGRVFQGRGDLPALLGGVAFAAILIIAMVQWSGLVRSARGKAALAAGLGCAAGAAFLTSLEGALAASLQTGLLDPIPLLQRSVNLVLLPLVDASAQKFATSPRHYEGAWLIGGILLTVLGMLAKFPRFYCRFICPLGAMFGILGRFALWRVGKREAECVQCELCAVHCEGACEPAGQIRSSECVLCMNCLDDCRHQLMTYQTGPSAAGEAPLPDLSRRGLVLAMASGLVTAPMVRLGAALGTNWNPALIRPPGALAEADFLTRCIKCGQCMRICPTNIIQPAELQAGLEGLWTPVLNFRIGTSGCQLNCVACGHLCPTAAIRPISLEEKLGKGAHAAAGPIRLGTAFVDRNRCLPWAMDRPCIVCQENCPVSPKAIFVEEVFRTVRGGSVTVRRADTLTLEIDEAALVLLPPPQLLTSGDYFVAVSSGPAVERRSIAEQNSVRLTLSADRSWAAVPLEGAAVAIQVRLQRPQVDPKLCIGCGVCEHECPVSGLRAIRVSAENETRHRKHSLWL
jgi:polyferredoxin/ferredoxin